MKKIIVCIFFFLVSGFGSIIVSANSVISLQGGQLKQSIYTLKMEY